MGCQRNICEKILEKDGDYVISLKENQGNLQQDVQAYFKDETFPIDHEWTEHDKGHGRVEQRICKVITADERLKTAHNWPGLKTIAMVKSRREIKTGDKTQVTNDVRYYVFSLDADAERIAKAARSHWGIENQLHWSLDATFNEDGSQIRTDNAPEIMNMFRKYALNLINTFKDEKTGVSRIMKRNLMNGRELIKWLERI